MGVAHWRSQAWGSLKLDEIIAEVAEDLPLPDADSKDQIATFSAVHDALHGAYRKGFFAMIQDEDPSFELPQSVIVISNRYSATHGLKPGKLSKYDVMALITYNDNLHLVELSGCMLAAIVRRNTFYAGRADFLYCSGIEYSLTV